MIIGIFLILAGAVGAVGSMGDGEYGTLAVSIVMIVFGVALISASFRVSKADANRLYFWEHYYDDNRTAARNRRR